MLLTKYGQENRAHFVLTDLAGDSDAAGGPRAAFSSQVVADEHRAFTADVVLIGLVLS
jgi:hypothetical protein